MRESQVEDMIHVATPYGNGNLLCHSESSNESDSDYYDTSMVRVEFPWGYMRIHMKEISFKPEFVFCAFHKGEKIKFRLCLSLDSYGDEMIRAVRDELDVAEDMRVTLVQADSVHKVEIQSHKRIVDCSINVRHPILVIVSPLMQYRCNIEDDMVECLENKTRLMQRVDGFTSVMGNFTIERGIRYWEVLLVNADGSDGIVLGVATKILDRKTNVFFEPEYWGISCRNGHKVSGIVTSYTDAFQNNDVVGILMDMKLGQLTFYKNNRFLGIAYRRINAKRLYPVFTTTCRNQALQLLQNTSPPLN